MDTRALGGEFLPRGEILTVEMKTVTQYTALIQLTAQMQEQERIPDPRERKRSFSDIDHMYGIYVNGALRVSAIYSHRSYFSQGKSFTGFHNPFHLKAF